MRMTIDVSIPMLDRLILFEYSFREMNAQLARLPEVAQIMLLLKSQIF